MTPSRRELLQKHLTGFITELVALFCNAPQDVSQTLEISDEIVTINVIFNHVESCVTDDPDIRCVHVSDCSRFVGVAGETVIKVRKLLADVGHKYRIPRMILLVTDPQSGKPTKVEHAENPRPLRERLEDAARKKQQPKV